MCAGNCAHGQLRGTAVACSRLTVSKFPQVKLFTAEHERNERNAPHSLAHTGTVMLMHDHGLTQVDDLPTHAKAMHGQ